MSRWVTFDCYGTLADWRTGMRQSLEPVAGERTGELLDAYYALEPAVQSELATAAYREILAETLRRAAGRIGLELAPGQDQALAEGWPRMPIFEDTAPTLRALREAGWKLGVLTNCDDDLIAATLAAIGVTADMVVTAGDAGSYKPAHGHFNVFADRTEHERELWIHAANSVLYDITPASELGLPRVWVDRDRTGEDPSIATARIDDLRPLPEVVERLAA